MNNQYNQNNNQYNNQYNNGNGYNNGYYNQNNGYNMNNQYNQYNQNSFNQPIYTPPPKKSHGKDILGILLVFILLIACVLYLLQYTGVFDVVSYVKENWLKEDTVQREVLKEETDKEEEEDELTDTEKANKEELAAICKLTDSSGNYKYQEFLDYVTEEVTKLNAEPTDEQIYEIMSKMNYCVGGGCMKIESDGMVNFLNCTNGEYVRMTYDDFQEYLDKKVETSNALTNACANVDSNGNYVIEDSTLTENDEGFVECKEYVCKVRLYGVTSKRDCKS